VGRRRVRVAFCGLTPSPIETGVRVDFRISAPKRSTLTLSLGADGPDVHK
jgi:hypothetical protein